VSWGLEVISSESRIGDDAMTEVIWADTRIMKLNNIIAAVKNTQGANLYVFIFSSSE
jgi:hypothetical protein